MLWEILGRELCWRKLPCLVLAASDIILFMLTTDRIRSIVDAACCGNFRLLLLPHFLGPPTTAVLVDEPIDGDRLLLCARCTLF